MLEVSKMGGKRWTKKELRYLIRMYGQIPTKKIGKQLRRSFHAIQDMAYHLGLSYTTRKRMPLKGIYVENMNCPRCGKPMIKHHKKAIFDCRNPSCPVIFVRIHRRGKRVVVEPRFQRGYARSIKEMIV